MPGTRKITKIERQKRNKNRVSIYLDDQFAFGLDLEVATQFDLREGAEVSQETIDTVLLKEEKKGAKNKAFRYLAGRAHSEKELRDKLRLKGFSKPIVEEVLAELKVLKFIDDSAFAASYVRSRMINRPCGETLLRHELWQKGVSEEIAKSAVKAFFSEHNQVEVARALAEKLRPRYSRLDATKRKKRLSDFLLRRGFAWELVKEVVEINTED
ncbi:MAG: RecX family transcriptional regulator [bacterium]